jgi:hypothetical protein
LDAYARWRRGAQFVYVEEWKAWASYKNKSSRTQAVKPHSTDPVQAGKLTMPSSLPHPRGNYDPEEISRAGLAAFAVLLLLMISASSICLSRTSVSILSRDVPDNHHVERRIQAARDLRWTRVPPTIWSKPSSSIFYNSH